METSEPTRTAPGPGHSLRTGVLRSERRRTTVTAGTFALMIVLLLAVTYLPGAWPAALAGAARDMFWPLLALFGGMMVYELVLRLRIRGLLLQSRLPTWLYRYANAALETSVPSVILLILCLSLDPPQAMASAAPLLYPLFIFMTVLNLDFWVCVFSGTLAASQFLLLAFVIIGDTPPLAGLEMLTDPAGYVVKAALLLASGVLAGVLTVTLRHQMQEAVAYAEQRDHAVSVFGQHVSPEIAQRLLQQNIDVAGEMREACVMFLDIRGFSRIASEKTPHEVMLYLNTLFGELIDVVNSQRGIVNKFLGDGFMAVFGAPADDAQCVPHALNAANEILARVAALNRAGSIPFTQVGIGLHIGPLVTGNVGTSQRKEYTLIGETVNLASRIEQATKGFDARLLVSDAVWNRLAKKPRDYVDLGDVPLHGLSRSVRLYKLS